MRVSGFPQAWPCQPSATCGPARAETEEHAAAGEEVERRDGRRGGRGRSRRHLHDRGAELDLFRAPADPRERRDGVRAVGLRRPHGVEAAALRLLREADPETGSSYPSCRPRRIWRILCPMTETLFPPEYLEARARYRAFMEEHVYPNEAAIGREDDAAMALLEELREPGPRRGPLGAARSAGGGRHRARVPLLRVSQRGDRALDVRAARVRLPGAGRGQRRDPPPVRHGRAEGALPAAARRGRGAVVLLDDRARGLGLGPDPAPDAGRARRRRVGDRRAQVVLERRRRRGVRGRVRDLGPGRRAAPARDDDPRPRRHAGGRGRATGSGDGARRAAAGAPTARCATRAFASRWRTRSAGRGTRSCSRRSASARGGSTT